jgi:hypothetical protein
MTATVTPIRENVPDETREAQHVGLTVPQMLALSGITYRQLDYWTRTGLLHAIGQDCPGTGRNRSYSEAEMRIARAGRRLLVAGFEVGMALAYARQLVQGGQPLVIADGLVVIIDPAGGDQ